MSITIVIGASLDPKLLIVCATPSSMIRKFSFFRPVSRSPWFVAAITSMVTTGTSTAMLAPASCGFCGGGAGFGSAGGAPCCWPPCGPSGACPRAFGAPTEKVSAPAKTIDKPLEKFAFMLGPSFYNHKRTYAGAATPGGRVASNVRDCNRSLPHAASSLHPHVSMKHICLRALLVGQVPVGQLRMGQVIITWKVEDGFVDFEPRYAHARASDHDFLGTSSAPCCARYPSEPGAASSRFSARP